MPTGTRDGHRAGQIIAERYQLLEEIGSGGMGAVWRARHIVNGETVALKLLHSDVGNVDTARERFLREARALHSLRSAQIVQVFDSGVDSGIPFIAMELLVGETLARRLRLITRLPVSEVRDVISQVAQGIGAAHEMGIVHRDLKPENIFLVRDDNRITAKILDFGIAKAKASDVPLRTLTQTGVMLGTPYYMSPEQIDGLDTDWRTDLWALAVITFECLIGVRPFNASAIPRLCFAICEDPLPIPSAFRPTPPGFDEWFRKGVARKREERFQSARDLADGLMQILSAAPTAPTAIALTDDFPLTLLCIQVDDEPRLIQHMGEDYPGTRDRLLALIGDAAHLGGAMVVEPGRVYAFPSTASALETAIALQLRMQAERWPRGYVVSLRTALGDGKTANTDIGVADEGLDRTRALCSAGHGGQILVAQAIATRARAGAGDVRFVDLGEHEIDDDVRERVFQVVAPGLNARFAPLSTKGGAPNNLPSEITEFFGRTEDMRALSALITRQRLVTLRGPGGVGKSRLAVRVAGEHSPAATDGTFLVPLAAARDAQLVLPTIASVLDVAESGGRSTFEALADHLAPREMLLVLDNFEHVMGAAADVERLLASAPRVRALVTSRTALSIDGESVYDVGPFELPASDTSADVLARNDAVQLFLDRARRANPSIALSAENARAIADIVRKVDGVPLAIELAAARLDQLSPAEVAKQLAASQASLHDASGDVARRHRTLGDVVAWSYQLLGAEERQLFRRLAAFVGGFTRALAEAVVGGGEPSVIAVDAGIATLVGNSLLRPETHERSTRFMMLESIREFALVELEKTAESTHMRMRHAHAMCDLVSAAAPELKREGAVATRDRLALEDGNLRAALDYCLSTRAGELGVKIASSVWRYWQSVGRLQEGRRWLVELLALPDITLATRARGLDALGGLAYWQADYATATSRYREALTIFRDLGDRIAVGETLFALSTSATWSGDSALGEDLAGQALTIFEDADAREQVGMVRMAQGFARWMQNDLRAARPLWEASIEIAREVGDRVEAAHKTLALAAMTFAEEGEERADAAIEQAIDAMEELFRQHNVALTVMAIDFVAAMTVTEQPRLAARLSGAATQLRGTMGGGMRPEACGLPSVSEVATRSIGAKDFRVEFDQGRKLDLFKAIELVRTLSPPPEATHAEPNQSHRDHS